MPLFDVAIVQHPTPKELEEGTGEEKLIYGPKTVVAKDANTAAIAAIMAEDAPKKLDLIRSQVLIRPFVSAA